MKELLWEYTRMNCQQSSIKICLFLPSWFVNKLSFIRLWIDYKQLILHIYIWMNEWIAMSEYELGNRGDNENELRTVFNQDFFYFYPVDL